MIWSGLDGLIPIVLGAYVYLMAIGKIPRHPKDPEKMELWRQKFGPMMKILGPLVILFGILKVAGIIG